MTTHPTAPPSTDHPPAVRTPCSEPNPCEGGEPCDRHETEQAHAEGEHTFCGPTCEVEFPTDRLRTFILAKGYPGTGALLDELLRRAAAGQPADVHAHRAAVLREAADIVRSMDSDYALQEAAGHLDGLAVEADESRGAAEAEAQQ